jgi:RNase adaptor protein for sRNA GlmZ degradation
MTENIITHDEVSKIALNIMYDGGKYCGWQVQKNAPSVQQKMQDTLEDLLGFLLPSYVDEGKTNLVIAVGCTGGKHRSVSVAREIGEFAAKRGYAVTFSHRDLGRR